ncbi:hypothetical protein ACFOY8_13810 [Thalassospira xianhensis]|uniref:Uncharacterized protein n=2 Tax=Thalassospira TaxID=168934 RepID=A0A285TS80_9PROT|nr:MULTISPECIES: hypothetical protein [Thalassospira]RCK07743.1 hypothetical protein TH5_01465 [Thalassospira xianhensis MCCC 1A02616]SOC26719.1 hypothetical protein SAMN05428964_105187 [Thalassospira xiamenensis]
MFVKEEDGAALARCVDFGITISVWDWTDEQFEVAKNLMKAMSDYLSGAFSYGLSIGEMEEDIITNFGGSFIDVDIEFVKPDEVRVLLVPVGLY